MDLSFSVPQKTLLKTFAGRLPASAAPVITGQDNDEAAGPTIVISAHCEDASLVSVTWFDCFMLKVIGNFGIFFYFFRKKIKIL